MSQTLEQRRAQYALAFIRSRGSDDNEKLLTFIRKMPVQILQNGLGQTLAYLLADAARNTTPQGAPSRQLYGFLETWLCEAEHPCQVYNGEGELIDQLISGSRPEYMRAQQEVLTVLVWLKKFADAWL